MEDKKSQIISDYEYIFDKIKTMLGHIARNNSDFKCSCCLDTADDLLLMAAELIGKDAAGILETEYRRELDGEDEE